MPPIITPTVARRLQKVVERFKHDVPPPSGNWEQMTDAGLWGAVLVQIAVVGSANSGERLKRQLAHDLDSWYEKLKSAPSASRQKAIHTRLRSARVRYVTADARTCKKSESAAYNFDLLEAYGGPKKYFTNLASVPIEFWRVGIVSDEMAYIRSKGARDLLIDLGLVENAIALDSRLQTVLKNVGASLPSDLATNRAKYRSLEQELLEKVCEPCSITGGHLDRILFSKWKKVS